MKYDLAKFDKKYFAHQKPVSENELAYDLATYLYDRDASLFHRNHDT